MVAELSVGLDFGTGSARAVLVDVRTGDIVAESTVPYPTGVWQAGARLAGFALPQHWALQQPADFVAAATGLLGWAAAAAQDRDARVLSIGVAATSCTVLPTTGEGTPLAQLTEFRDRPHAYAKLWKHRAASPWADHIEWSAPSFLERYNGQTSPEWSLAKAWQTMDEDPELWGRADRWIDLGDWVVWQLTGREVRSVSQAGCKNHWQPDAGGYPAAGQLDRIRPGLSSWLDKLGPPHALSTVAGPLTAEWRQQTGMPAEAQVCVAIVDAQAAVSGSDVHGPGVLVAALGTSTCHVSLSRRVVPVAGVESIVNGAAIAGFFDYSTGQPATGDMFAWLVRLLRRFSTETPDRILERLAASLGAAPDTAGAGVAVTDWWNGARMPSGTSKVSGSIEGLEIGTTVDDIYAAMVDASAMGVRFALRLHEQVEDIVEIRVTGGLARFPEVMQRYADVIGRPIRTNATTLGTARGAALTAAGAVGAAVPDAMTFVDFLPRNPERFDEPFARYASRLDGLRAVPPVSPPRPRR